MKKRILNILIIISIVFISMFVNKNVEASETCSYVLPMTFIDISKKEPRFLAFEISSKYKIPDRQVMSLNVDCGDEFCYLTYKYIKNNKMSDSDEIIINPDLKPSGKITEKYMGEIGECSDYFIIESKTDNWKFVNGSSYATAFSNLLQNQYKGATTTKFSMLKSSNAGDLETEAAQFSKYTSYVGDIVLINKNLTEKYQTGKYSKFVDALKKEDGGDDALTRFPVDKNETNTRSITKKYYELTGSSWSYYYYNKIKGYAKTYTQHQLIANWFYYAGRDLIEVSPQRFKDIFSYIFDGYIDSDDYDKYMNAIDSVISYNDAIEKQSCFDNPCNVYCTTQEENGSGKCYGPAWDQCVKYDSNSKQYTGNQDYGKCKKAYDECISTYDCSKYNKDSPAYTQCTQQKANANVDSCLKQKLGEEEYNRMKEKEKNQKEAIEQEKQDALNKFIYNLSRISAPTLDIDFDKHYKLTCDDVSFFHGFYVVLRIIAPIAVVFFGTLDYAKAVIASDVEKMNKSKKNFPKRLLLLILFIGVPLIISLLLNVFGEDYSLMKCIINGE